MQYNSKAWDLVEASDVAKNTLNVLATGLANSSGRPLQECLTAVKKADLTPILAYYANVFSSNYNDDELNELIKIHNNPVMKKSMRIISTIVSTNAAVMQRWMAENAPLILAALHS